MPACVMVSVLSARRFRRFAGWTGRSVSTGMPCDFFSCGESQRIRSLFHRAGPARRAVPFLCIDKERGERKRPRFRRPASPDALALPFRSGARELAILKKPEDRSNNTRPVSERNNKASAPPTGGRKTVPCVKRVSYRCVEAARTKQSDRRGFLYSSHSLARLCFSSPLGAAEHCSPAQGQGEAPSDLLTFFRSRVPSPCAGRNAQGTRREVERGVVSLVTFLSTQESHPPAGRDRRGSASNETLRFVAGEKVTRYFREHAALYPPCETGVPPG